MRFRRFSSLVMTMVLAATVLVGFQPSSAEARGFHGRSHGGSHHGKFHHGGFRHLGFNRHHHFRGSSFFLGLGLGLVGFPYAYSAYYPAYPSYGATAYAPYSPYSGACYAYDVYGRCISYAPRGGYYYPY